MPDTEYWTYGAHPAPGRRGFNFGAPGDRRAQSGTLWQATPVGADPDYPSRNLVAADPATPQRFYHHSSRVKGEGPWKWIGGSGLLGLRSAKVPLDGIDTDQPLVVRLVFAEPEHDRPGRRVFSVALDGKLLVEDLDIVGRARGPLRVVVEEFPAVRYSGRKSGGAPVMELRFTPRIGEPLICGIEVIEAGRLDSPGF
jgi:hypothetical protein